MDLSFTPTVNEFQVLKIQVGLYNVFLQLLARFGYIYLPQNGFIVIIIVKFL